MKKVVRCGGVICDESYVTSKRKKAIRQPRCRKEQTHHTPGTSAIETALEALLEQRTAQLRDLETSAINKDLGTSVQQETAVIIKLSSNVTTSRYLKRQGLNN